MKEIWETPFGGAMLKIERANKHIEEFGERLLASADCYGPSLKVDGKTGEQFLYYGLEDRYLRSDLALITGDALHNIRSALDIAWGEIVGSSSTKFTKFPIDSTQTKQWLEGVLTKNAGVKRASAMFDFIVNHVKGYKGGDSEILALNDLDIDDKHHLLIPMLTVLTIQGVELENKDGSIDRFNIGLTRFRPYRKPVGQGAKLKKHGDIRFNVTFGQGTPTEGLEILPTLERFSEKVFELIMHLRRLK